MIRTMLKEIILQRSKQKKRAERLAKDRSGLRRGAESKEYYSASGLRIEFWTPTGAKGQILKKKNYFFDLF